MLGVTTSAYFLAPVRTNALLLGIDRAPAGTFLARSDTLVLVTVVPLKPYIGLLAIPRDLWVLLPDVGENRINTAHFFGENLEPGSGPAATRRAVEANFGVDVHYFVRLDFESLERFVDVLGGVELVLDKPAAGYPPGRHMLDPREALAFVRDRTGDDFFRMSNGQLFLRAAVRQMLKPSSWPRFPSALAALSQGLQTDVPVWEWPRLALAVLRAGSDGLDSRVIGRDMVHGFTTPQGAQVLRPEWDKINPLLVEMFGRPTP